MKWLFWVAALVFAGLAAISLRYALAKTADATGAIDFHSYWIAGQFLRLGRDPYSAYTQGATLSVAQPGLANVPANTAPLVWLLAGFAWLPWPAAKSGWLALNLLLAALTPWLTWRLLPGGGAALGWRGKLLLALFFWGIFGTRNIAGNGQTSLLVFALMLAAAGLPRRHWLAGGLLLGVAVSKYSLALPLVLLFATQRRWRELAVAGGVQMAALLAVSVATNTPIGAILAAYWQIFRLHTGLEGVHIGSLFPGNGWAGLAAAAVLTAGVLGWLVWGGRRSGGWGRRSSIVLLTILMLWTLLVAYHRAYDTFTAILFVGLAGWGLASGAWGLSGRERVGLAAALLASAAVLCLPARGAALVFGDSLGAWLDVQGHGMTLALLAMLGGGLWVWGRQEKNTT